MDATCQIFSLLEALNKDDQTKARLATLQEQHNCTPAREGAYFRLLLNKKPFVDSGPQKVSPVVGDSDTAHVDINTTDAIRNGGCAVFHGAASLHIHPGVGTRWPLSGDFILDGWARISENQLHNTILSYGTFRDGILLRPGKTDSLWVVNQHRNCTSFFPINTWVYFALVRSGGTVELWTAQQGQPRAELRASIDIGNAVINPENINPILGRSTHRTDEHLRGMLADFRLYHPTSQSIDKSKVPFSI